MEVALLLGLAALGYALAPQIARQQRELQEQRKRNPKETFISPADFKNVDDVTVVQAEEGHNNMVPFFGANVTQTTYNGATDGILDTYTGSGKNTFFHKEEAPAFFKPEVATGLPWGKQVETDFEQSRMVTSLAMKNVFPIEPVQVGPGVNDGYTNLPSGGYQQDSIREFALPKTTDEIRAANKPKLTYSADPIPGQHFITEMGLQAPVKKNRPDRFQVLEAKDGSLPHVNCGRSASRICHLPQSGHEGTEPRKYFSRIRDARTGRCGWLSVVHPCLHRAVPGVHEADGRGSPQCGWSCGRHEWSVRRSAGRKCPDPSRREPAGQLAWI